MRSARGSLTDAAGSLTDAVLSPLRRSRRESAGPDEAAVSLRQSEDEALLSYLSNHRGACLQSGWVELENPAAGRLDRKYKRRWFEIHPHALVWYKLHAPELPKGYLLLSSTHAAEAQREAEAARSPRRVVCRPRRLRLHHYRRRRRRRRLRLYSPRARCAWCR